MRAVLFDRLDASTDDLGLVVRDIDTPEPGEHEVRIRVAAYGLNQADLLLMAGRHYEVSELPMRIGYEASGIVDAVGSGVTRWSVGDRVATIPNIDGPYSCGNEYALAHEDFLGPWPAGWSAAEAAGFWMQYLTAYYPMREIFPVSAGSHVLITAASGGTGLGAIRIAKLLGARVIATTRTSEKRAFLLEQGADAVIATDESEVAAELLRLTDGHGADLVSDGVGGPFVAEYVEALATDGIAYVHGGLSGTNEVSFPVLALVRKRAGLYGYSLINETRDPEKLRRGIRFVSDHLADGSLGRPVIDRAYPLEEVGAAYERMRSGQQRGKLIIEF